MYMIFRSYRLYLGRLEEQKKRVEVEELQVKTEKRHVEEVCALHLRTIEGLALAIDAKDHTTHAHLHRVRTYAIEIAKELEPERRRRLDAMRAAALLHDIGKLAVPDHIINKPGRLTPEEFEKMKIHPVSGRGHPGEEWLFLIRSLPSCALITRSGMAKVIPTDSREKRSPSAHAFWRRSIASMPLASDRQYRKALPLDEAMDADLGGGRHIV